jgi:hypothetical protein
MPEDLEPYFRPHKPEMAIEAGNRVFCSMALHQIAALQSGALVPCCDDILLRPTRKDYPKLS